MTARYVPPPYMGIIVPQCTPKIQNYRIVLGARRTRILDNPGFGSPSKGVFWLGGMGATWYRLRQALESTRGSAF